MVKIGFVTLDWSPFLDPETLQPTPGGAAWYRMSMPQRALAANGYNTILGYEIQFDGKTKTLCVKDWDDEIHEDVDVIVIQRWMHAVAPAAIYLARAAGQVVVNDVDDWYPALTPSNVAYHFSDPKRNPWSNREHYLRVIEASSLVTCSTPYIVEQAAKINPNVALVRNAIDLDRWETHDLGGDPVVGWCGATPFRSRDVEELRGILLYWLRDNGGAMFHGGHIPNMNYPSVAQLLSKDPSFEPLVRKVPMQSILNWPKLYKYFNIGVVPLSNVPFNHAKSAIKGMECAAAGVPFIASPTPEYEWLASEHGIGMLARSVKDWNRGLDGLRDEEIRKTVGEWNRGCVTRLDIGHQWKTWAEVYEQAVA